MNNNLPDSGEGSDCSGFAGRAWFLNSFAATTNPPLGFRSWSRLTKYIVHPNSNFYVGTPNNNNWISTTQPTMMDLGAKNGHVVLTIIHHNDETYTVIEQTGQGGVGRLDRRELDDIADFRRRTGWLP